MVFENSTVFTDCRGNTTILNLSWNLLRKNFYSLKWTCHHLTNYLRAIRTRNIFSVTIHNAKQCETAEICVVSVRIACTVDLQTYEEYLVRIVENSHLIIAAVISYKKSYLLWFVLYNLSRVTFRLRILNNFDCCSHEKFFVYFYMNLWKTTKNCF